MAAKPLPSAEDLRQVFDYNPETGSFHWKANSILPKTPMRTPGKAALTSSTAKGYKRGGVFGRNCMAHRVAWKIVYGTEPEEVDHINGVKSDNRICNLRSASRTENVRNVCRSRKNTSGVTGVYPRRGKWIAGIRDGSKHIYIGAFDTLEEAASARKDREIAIGYHKNHGRVL